MRKSPSFLLHHNILWDAPAKCGSNSAMSVILYDLELKPGSHKNKDSYWSYRDENTVFSNPNNYPIVKISRNPRHRLLSQFFHYCRFSKNIHLSFNSFVKSVSTIREIYSSSDKKEIDFFSNYGSVLDNLLPKLGQEYKVFEMLFDQVNLAQKFDHLIKCENMFDGFVALDKSIHTNYSMNKELFESHLNVTPKKTSQTLYMPNLPELPFSSYALAIPADYNCFYTGKTTEDVQYICKDDEALLGY